jgi:phosphoribosylanthranilate isomerase
MKLKICGVKSVEEARQLRKVGVDLIGLNFIPTSKRCITIETAEAIIAEFQGSGIQTVALFADKPIDEVNNYSRRLQINFVQLHGNEPPDYAKQIEASVIRAIPVDPAQPADQLIDFINNFPADYFVLDRQQQGQGDLVNSEQANQIIAANPNKIFLAGGLNPDNLQTLINQTHPYGIDIAAGVRDQNDNLDVARVSRCQEIIHHPAK